MKKVMKAFNDVLKISNLPDEEFELLIPDSEVIIGSPPCVSFSNSNKSGNNDKSEGIQLILAFLRIVARKKWKKDWDNVIYCSDKCRKTKSLKSD